ncbi:MAG: hypothetical protein A2Z76_04720 [Chloroflexi bacterium RBG_13_56_8b]|nr:MAG: hypothetical protein A2Z76_04720 [Chloroflexi bacterium RBG_13_56_8b]
MDVVTGDSIGIHYSAGTLENDTGTIYARYTSGDYIPCTNQPFNTSGRLLSLYGEGGTEATEKSSSDGGSGVEDTPAQSAVLAGSESGSGVDAVESLQTPQVKTSSDAGSGVEGTPSQSAILAGGESGSGLEALITRLLATLDTGSGAEASSVEIEGLLKDLFASEPGEGCDRLVAKIEMPIKGGGMKLWT